LAVDSSWIARSPPTKFLKQAPPRAQKHGGYGSKPEIRKP
jgi:hypothetical protein